MFRRFGSEVTIIQSAPRLIMLEDGDVADEVAAILRDDGISVMTSANAVLVESAGGTRVRLPVRSPDGEQQLEGSHLPSAIGRLPNTEALASEAGGIRLDDRGFIEVDEHLVRVFPASMRWGTSSAARPSPTFPTTTTGSCTPT